MDTFVGFVRQGLFTFSGQALELHLAEAEGEGEGDEAAVCMGGTVAEEVWVGVPRL